MILACFSATYRFWCSNDENIYPKLKMWLNATVISLFGLKSLRSLNAGAYLTADQNISLLTSLSSYFQKPLKIRKNGFEIRVKNDQRQVIVNIWRKSETNSWKIKLSVQGIPLENRTNFPYIIIFRHPCFYSPHSSIFPSPQWNCTQSLT